MSVTNQGRKARWRRGVLLTTCMLKEPNKVDEEAGVKMESPGNNQASSKTMPHCAQFPLFFVSIYGLLNCPGHSLWKPSRCQLKQYDFQALLPGEPTPFSLLLPRCRVHTCKVAGPASEATQLGTRGHVSHKKISHVEQAVQLTAPPWLCEPLSAPVPHSRIQCKKCPARDPEYNVCLINISHD